MNQIFPEVKKPKTEEEGTEPEKEELQDPLPEKLRNSVVSACAFYLLSLSPT